ERLIAENGKRPASAQSFEDLANASVRARMPEESRVVDREKPSERVGWGQETGGSERARDERRCAVSHHLRDRIFRQRTRTRRLEHQVRRLGDVTLRVHKGTVQIKHYE